MASDTGPTEQFFLIATTICLLFSRKEFVRTHKRKTSWERAKKKLGDNMRKLRPVEEFHEDVDKISRAGYKTYDCKNDALIRDVTQMLE